MQRYQVVIIPLACHTEMFYMNLYIDHSDIFSVNRDNQILFLKSLCKAQHAKTVCFELVLKI